MKENEEMKEKRNLKEKTKAFLTPKSNGKKTLIIILSVLLSAVILFGAVLGTVIAVRNAGYLISYGSVGVDEGVAVYLTSYYKAVFMANLRKSGYEVADTEEFWNTKMSNSMTVGDYLAYATEEYIKDLVAANYLFNRSASLSREDKEDLNLAVQEKLDYIAGGSVETFNEMTAEYGFDYKDFKTATEMLYKAWSASVKIFGENGENMVNYLDGCEEYFKNYAHANLIFIRTESEFVLDEDGERVKDEDGNDKTRPLTDAEKASRQELIAEMKDLVKKMNAGEADKSKFFELQRDYDEGDRTSHSKGYYFASEADYTEEFAEEFSEVVNMAMELEIGKMGFVDCSVGVCFIYRTERDKTAFADTSDDWCFSDFFKNAAADTFQKMLDEISEQITPRDKWDSINPVTVPYNTDFVARF